MLIAYAQKLFLHKSTIKSGVLTSISGVFDMTAFGGPLTCPGASSTSSSECFSLPAFIHLCFKRIFPGPLLSLFIFFLSETSNPVPLLSLLKNSYCNWNQSYLFTSSVHITCLQIFPVFTPVFSMCALSLLSTAQN